MRTGLALATAATAATGGVAHEVDQRVQVIAFHSAPVATPILTPMVIDRLLSVRDRYAARKGHTHEARLGWGPLTLSATGFRLHGRGLSPETPFRQPDRLSASAVELDAALDCGADVSLHVFSLAQRVRRQFGSLIGSDRSIGSSVMAIGIEAEHLGLGSIVLDYTTTRTRGRSGALSRMAEEVAGGTPGGTMTRLSLGNARATAVPGELSWTVSAAALRRSPADREFWSGASRTDRRALVAFRIAF